LLTLREHRQFAWGWAYDDPHARILLEQRSEDLVVLDYQCDSFYRTRFESLQELGREEGLPHKIHAQPLGLGLDYDNILALDSHLRPPREFERATFHDQAIQ